MAQITLLRPKIAPTLQPFYYEYRTLRWSLLDTIGHFGRVICCCLINISIPVPKIPLGFSATELSKRLGVSQPAVSVEVKQGEKIAQTERLESEENYKAIILYASCKFPVSGSDL